MPKPEKTNMVLSNVLNLTRPFPLQRGEDKFLICVPNFNISLKGTKICVPSAWRFDVISVKIQCELNINSKVTRRSSAPWSLKHDVSWRRWSRNSNQILHFEKLPTQILKSISKTFSQNRDFPRTGDHSLDGTLSQSVRSFGLKEVSNWRRWAGRNHQY